MEFIEKYGKYKIWHFPRKAVYRVSTIDNPRVFRLLNHKFDFKSVDEIKNIIKELEAKSDIHYIDPYNVAIQWLRNEDNKNNIYYDEINLLVNQYYCGIEPKKELRKRLSLMGLVNN